MAKGLIFDFDNTLAVNSQDSDIAIARIIENITGKTITLSDIGAFTSDYQLCAYFLKGDQLERAYDLILEENLKYIEHFSYPPGLFNVLSTLKKDYLLFIASGRDQASLRESISREGLADFFCDIIGDVPGQTPKPHPSMLLQLFEKHHLNSSDCIYIGDKDSDFLFADSAGCKFIASSWFVRKITIEPVKFCLKIEELPADIAQTFQNASAC